MFADDKKKAEKEQKDKQDLDSKALAVQQLEKELESNK